jgi:hypothetical protein
MNRLRRQYRIGKSLWRVVVAIRSKSHCETIKYGASVLRLASAN